MTPLNLCAAATAVLLTLSSLPVLADEITTLGYESKEFQFTVLFGQPTTQDFVGPEWRLANFEKDRGRFERNKTDYHKDVDLVLENELDNGILFVQAFRVRKVREKKKLDVVVRNIADSMAGSGLFVDISPGVVRVNSYEFATFIRDAKIWNVGGQQGHMATIEMARVVQLQLNAKHRDRVMTVAVLRVAVREDEVGEGEADEADTGLVVVGYVNSPDYFAAGQPAFERFLGNVRLGATEATARATASADAQEALAEEAKRGTVVFDASATGHSSQAGTQLSRLLADYTGQRILMVRGSGEMVGGRLSAFNGRIFFVDTANGRETVPFDQVARLVVLGP